MWTTAYVKSFESYGEFQSARGFVMKKSSIPTSIVKLVWYFSGHHCELHGEERLKILDFFPLIDPTETIRFWLNNLNPISEAHLELIWIKDWVGI